MATPLNIGINAGHTKTGPGSGAVGYLNESTETRNVYKYLVKELQARGHSIVNCTIDKASSQSEYLSMAVAIANREDLDYFISIHFNAGGGTGTETYTYNGQKYADAVEVTDNIAKLGFKNRGIKVGTGLYVIRKTKAKSMLIEVCFVDTKKDAEIYKNLGASKIAKAIASAFPDCSTKKDKDTPGATISAPKKKYVRVTYAGSEGLIVRRTPDWNAKAVDHVHKGDVFTVSSKLKVGNSYMFKLKSGLYITASTKYVETFTEN